MSPTSRHGDPAMFMVSVDQRLLIGRQESEWKRKLAIRYWSHSGGIGSRSVAARMLTATDRHSGHRFPVVRGHLGFLGGAGSHPITGGKRRQVPSYHPPIFWPWRPLPATFLRRPPVHAVFIGPAESSAKGKTASYRVRSPRCHRVPDPCGPKGRRDRRDQRDQRIRRDRRVDRRPHRRPGRPPEQPGVGVGRDGGVARGADRGRVSRGITLLLTARRRERQRSRERASVGTPEHGGTPSTRQTRMAH